MLTRPKKDLVSKWAIDYEFLAVRWEAKTIARYHSIHPSTSLHWRPLLVGAADVFFAESESLISCLSKYCILAFQTG